MKIRMKQYNDVTILFAAGTLDALTAPALTKAFEEQIAAGHARLVADLKKVDYTSSAGVRVLIRALQASRRHGGDLRLSAVQPHVNTVLELTGVTTILKIYPNVVAATASYFN